MSKWARNAKVTIQGILYTIELYVLLENNVVIMEKVHGDDRNTAKPQSMISNE
jgi:hypothetical protein